MNIISASSRLIAADHIAAMKNIEFAGRNCYRSQDKITDTSYDQFIRRLIKMGHEAPLEFAEMTFDIITSRSVMAEMTRHRLASFCIESQRYVNYGNGIDFIAPVWFDPASQNTVASTSNQWKRCMEHTEAVYDFLLANGMKPQQAREVLPNSTAVHIVVKANVREWRHFFDLRCSPAAYPEMRTLALGMLVQAAVAMPAVFDDMVSGLIKKGEMNNGNDQ